MKMASTTACVIANGGSVCVGAEALHDSNKDVKVERCDNGDHVDPAPSA